MSLIHGGISRPPFPIMLISRTSHEPSCRLILQHGFIGSSQGGCRHATGWPPDALQAEPLCEAR